MRSDRWGSIVVSHSRRLARRSNSQRSIFFGERAIALSCRCTISKVSFFQCCRSCSRGKTSLFHRWTRDTRQGEFTGASLASPTSDERRANAILDSSTSSLVKTGLGTGRQGPSGEESLGPPEGPSSGDHHQVIHQDEPVAGRDVSERPEGPSLGIRGAPEPNATVPDEDAVCCPADLRSESDSGSRDLRSPAPVRGVDSCPAVHGNPAIQEARSLSWWFCRR